MGKTKKRQDAWNVYFRGRLIDTVFCTVGAYNALEMKRSLINHDNYPYDIWVKLVNQ